MPRQGCRPGDLAGIGPLASGRADTGVMAKMWLWIALAVVALLVAAGAAFAAFLVFAQRYLWVGGTCESLHRTPAAGARTPASCRPCSPWSLPQQSLSSRSLPPCSLVARARPPMLRRGDRQAESVLPVTRPEVRRATPVEGVSPAVLADLRGDDDSVAVGGDKGVDGVVVHRAWQSAGDRVAHQGAGVVVAEQGVGASGELPGAGDVAGGLLRRSCRRAPSAARCAGPVRLAKVSVVIRRRRVGCPTSRQAGLGCASAASGIWR